MANYFHCSTIASLVFYCSHMPSIFTSKGQEIIVSEDDFSSLNQYKWMINSKGYACRNFGGGNLVYMHRLLLNPPFGMCVDHINHNTLDNRRENLRIVSKAANCRHLLQEKRMKPQFVLARGKKPWRAAFRIRGTNRKNYTMSLGCFATEIEAQAVIDRYHTMCHCLQLEGYSQERIFCGLYRIRSAERIKNGERMAEKHASRILPE